MGRRVHDMATGRVVGEGVERKVFMLSFKGNRCNKAMKGPVKGGSERLALKNYPFGIDWVVDVETRILWLDPRSVSLF